MSTRVALTKAERVRRGRGVRKSMRLYDLWQDPAVTSSRPEVNAEERRWEWLLQARRELEELIHAERVAGGERWASFAARRSSS